MSDIAADAYNVTAEELRQFVERFEHLEAEKADNRRTAKRGHGRGQGARL